MKRPEKYVVLEHLNLPQKGLRFWTTNSDNNTHGHNRGLWYKEVAFTDSEDEAIKLSQATGVLPSSDELRSYYIEMDKNKERR